MVHHEAAAPPGWFAPVVLGVLLVATAAYAAAALRSGRRGRWPVHRTLLWVAGAVCAGVAVVLPLVIDDPASFTAHMVTHLLLGMLAPLFLVLSAPLTLALRTLPVPRARQLSALLRSPVVRVLTHPVVAAGLNVGGLWWLYTTDLFHRMHESDLLYALVHGHLVVVGYVFTASLIGKDPDPHRASMRVRSVVLVLFIAAHSVVAKWLYGHPPAGVDAGDARLGSQVMYYGGDAVDVVIIVLLFVEHQARSTRHDPDGGRRRQLARR